MRPPLPAELRSAVRRRLDRLRLRSQRRLELEEELTQMFRDAWADASLDPTDQIARSRWLEHQIVGLDRLVATLEPVDRPPTKGGASHLRRALAGIELDVRGALRQLWRRPSFTIVATATLAIAIGLGAAVFGLVDSLLFKPLGVAEPDTLMRIYSKFSDAGFLENGPLSYPDLADLREQSSSFDEIMGNALVQLVLEADGEPTTLYGEVTTGNAFTLLGLKPGLGRLLTEADDRRGEPVPVVVLSDRCWRERFGADTGIVGREVRVNGQPLTVVGVAPPGFDGLLRAVTPELWVPLALTDQLRATPTVNVGGVDPKAPFYEQRSHLWLWVVARRAAGVRAEQATAEMDTLGQALRTAYPESNENRGLTAVPLASVQILPQIDSSLRLASFVLLGLVAIVLLVVAANLGGMMLARALERRAEIAARLAVGAGRWRLTRQLLVESLSLASLGSLSGLALTWGANRLLAGFSLPNVPLSVRPALDHRVALFVLLAAGGTAVLFGLAPVLEALRVDLAAALQTGRGGVVRRRSLLGGLVVAQVCLSVILLVAGGLLLRGLIEAQQIDPGIDPDGVVVAYLDPELQGYDSATTDNLFERLAERIRGIAGVSSVAEASHLPLSLWINTWSAVADGAQHLPPAEWTEVDAAVVGPGYFTTVGTPIESGRDFGDTDRAPDNRAIIVNRELARRFWPGQDPIGRRVWLTPEGPPREVVGVAATGKYRTLGESPRPHLFVPMRRQGAGARHVVVRFSRPEQASLEPIRWAIREVDSHVAVGSLATLEQVTTSSRALPRAGVALFGGLGLFALLLAALGLYGLIATVVEQRTHEIGVRAALGADRRRIIAIVASRAALLAAAGLALGLALALSATRFLSSLLYGVSPYDAVTVIAVIVALCATAVVASAIPARRAAHLDPVRSLRAD